MSYRCRIAVAHCVRGLLRIVLLPMRVGQLLVERLSWLEHWSYEVLAERYEPVPPPAGSVCKIIPFPVQQHDPSADCNYQ